MQYGKNKLACLMLATALTLGLSSNAWAHKVISAAYTDGSLIEGEIGFSNGDMATNLLVEITDPDGNKLGEVITDDEGLFEFTATKKVDHIFRANLSAGHIATFSVTADELPNDLEGGAPASTSVAPASSNASETQVPENQIASALETGNLAVVDQRALETLVSKAAKETRSLRKELAQYKEERRLQDILGGIGYILGIFGVASFLLGRRKTGKET